MCTGMAFVTMLHQQRSDSGFEKTAADRRWTFCPSGSRQDNQHQMHTDDPQQVMKPETCVEVSVRRRACRTRHGVPSGFECNGDILCSIPFHTHRSPVVRRHAQRPTSLCAVLHSPCLPGISVYLESTPLHGQRSEGHATLRESATESCRASY